MTEEQGRALAALIYIAVGVGSVWFVVYLLLRLSRTRPTAMLPALITVITLVALAGFLITKSEVAGTLAGTGLGALCGALSAIYRDRKDDAAWEARQPRPPDQTPPSPPTPEEET